MIYDNVFGNDIRKEWKDLKYIYVYIYIKGLEFHVGTGLGFQVKKEINIALTNYKYKIS